MKIKKSMISICAMASIWIFLPGLVYSANNEQKPVRITPVEVEQAIALKEREESVLGREIELNKKEQEMEDLSSEIDDKLARLVKLQKEVKGYLEEFRTTKSREFANLVKVYSAMSASKLAPLLDKMDHRSVVQILRAMKVDKVAKVMPKLDKDKAVAISMSLGMMDKELN